MTPKNEIPTHKQCGDCGEIKPVSAFSKNGSAKDGLQFRCKDCQRIVSRKWAAANPAASKRWKEENPELAWVINRRSKLRDYNMTLEDYDILLESQGYVCAICKSDDPGRGLQFFNIDHDHSCCPGKKSCGQCVRGLLCMTCNTGVGSFKDDIEFLKNAITYLMGGTINFDVLRQILEAA